MTPLFTLQITGQHPTTKNYWPQVSLVQRLRNLNANWMEEKIGNRKPHHLKCPKDNNFKANSNSPVKHHGLSCGLIRWLFRKMLGTYTAVITSFNGLIFLRETFLMRVQFKKSISNFIVNDFSTTPYRGVMAWDGEKAVVALRETAATIEQRLILLPRLDNDFFYSEAEYVLYSIQSTEHNLWL